MTMVAFVMDLELMQEKKVENSNILLKFFDLFFANSQFWFQRPKMRKFASIDTKQKQKKTK